MAIEFGANPTRLTVRLAEDTDFRQYVRIPTTNAAGEPLPPWAPGVAIELRFIPLAGATVVWTAVIDPANDRRCGWDVDKVLTRPVLDLHRANGLKAVRWFAGDDYLGKGQLKDVT